MKRQLSFKVLATFILLSLFSWSDIYAQEQKVTVDVANVSLKKIFKEIEKQTTYRFSYQNVVLDKRNDITLSKTNSLVSSVLDEALKTRNLSYKIVSSKKIEIVFKNVLPKGKVKKISGVVKDKGGEPIMAANIKVEGTSNGTITDVDGKFNLDVPSDAVLYISFIGYESRRVTLDGRSVLNIILSEDSKLLNEVVVVGYGTVRKSDLTGSVANVTADETNKGGVTASLGGMLKGRIAGLTVTQGSPQPGGGADIVIRGRNSLFGSSAPLYIVDGFPYSPSGAPDAGDTQGFGSAGGRSGLNGLNPNDIESISVLKDAAATAIYGTRGSNGVIIITTKRGREGKLKINYDGYVGVQTQAKDYDLMNGREYMEYWNAQEAGPKFTTEQIRDAHTTNWVDKVTRNGFVQSHQMNLSAAANGLRYYFSAGYYNQEGILKCSEMDRFTVRGNIEYKRNRLKLNTNVAYANITDYNQPDGGGSRSSMLESAISFAPYLQPAEDGSYVPDPASNFRVYPISLLDVSDVSHTDRTDINTSVEYELVKGLKPQVKLGYTVTNGRRAFFIPSTTPVNGGLPDSNGRFHGGKASSTFNRSENITFEGLLNYKRTFAKRLNLVALAGYSYITDRWSGNRAKGDDFSPVDIFGPDKIDAANVQHAQSWKGESVIISGFGRLDLSWDDKYFLTGTIRRDGSSNFGENNKWGWFPGVSAAWKIKNESFLKDVSQLNQLKLRIGYGVTGNSGFGNYLSQSLYQVSSSRGALIGQQQLTAIRLSDVKGNPNLKWEKTAQLNIGIDVSAFNWFSMSLDFYKKKTSDLIVPLKLSWESGQEKQWVNAADFDVTGLELTMNADIIRTKNFNWSANFNLGWNDNKISKINVDGDVARAALADMGIIEGVKQGSFYMYKFKEIDEEGAMTFQDVNKDGEINTKDRTVCGNSNPNVTLGLGNRFSYKGFALEFFFDSALGRKMHNWNKANHIAPYYADPSNLYRCAMTEDNLPKYHNFTKGGDFINNDRWLENADFLRLQDLTLSYTLPTKLFGNFLSNLKFYVQGQNLFTVSDWSGVNPESNGLYPSLRSFTAGLNVTF